MTKRAAFLLAALMIPAFAAAQPEGREGHGRQPVDKRVDIAASIEDAHPVAPADASIWVAPMLMVVAAMFLSAMIVGPVARSEAPQEEPDSHHHHDDPAAHAHHH